MELVLVSLKFIRNKLMYTRSWQEYVRLVHKKGLFLGFVLPKKSSFFQFDRTTEIELILKDLRMPFIWLYFFYETHNSNLPLVTLSFSSQSALN